MEGAGPKESWAGRDLLDAPVSEMVRRWLAAGGSSASAVARRAGLSGSTLHRVLNDQVDPCIGTLREIAAACGRSLMLSERPLSDPAAAAAARSLLEHDYTPTLDVAGWTARLSRAAGDDPVSIVEAAGRASAPLLRNGTQIYSGQINIGRIASAGQASGGRWALSGAAGLTLPSLREPVPAPTILWCEDVRVVAQLLADSSIVRSRRSQTATLAVAEADGGMFSGSFDRGHVRYVAPIQILLDCFSLGGATAELAQKEARSW